MMIYIVLLLACLLFVIFVSSWNIKIEERIDGSFEPFKVDKSYLSAFFKENNFKPIDLSVKVTTPYHIKVRVDGQIKTLSVPTGYVTDGASKPIKWLPFPSDNEGSYWVYHDFMYQKQSFDDGTEVTKEIADKIMYLLILSEWKTILFPWKLLYYLFVFFYKRNDAKYRADLKRRGPLRATGAGLANTIIK